jgi:AcrR family transcriptional regulator
MRPSRGDLSTPRGGTPPGPFAFRRAPFELPASMQGLPTGRSQLSGEVLEQSHRNRVMVGAVKELGEHGYAASKVLSIIKAAGVSRNTFYLYFADKQECFLAAYDVVVAWLEHEATAALAGSTRWADKVRIASESTLALLGADPGIARLVAAEILCLGPAGQAHQRAAIDHLTPLLRLGRTEDPAAAQLSPRLELALLSGAISLVAREVCAGRGDRLPELAPDLLEFLLVPYLGVPAARRMILDEGSSAAPSATGR